jgi:beta-lactamase class A
MRSVPPAIEDRSALADYVEDCATGIDARLGVCIGYPTGPDFTDFDVVVSRRAARPYESASLIKLPVLRALYGRYDPSLRSLDQRQAIADRNRVGGAGVLHLFDPLEVTLRDLARAMIAISDNAATNQLIDHLGMAAVNEAASELGMTDTQLERKMMTTLEADDDTDRTTGESDAAKPLNTTSPRDCAVFFAALCHGSGQSPTARAEQRDMLRAQNDDSMFSRYVPYDCTVAHKTGWLPDAALDTGLVESDDHPPLFYAVFCDRAENGGDATDAIAEIGAATLEWSEHGEPR